MTTEMFSCGTLPNTDNLLVHHLASANDQIAPSRKLDTRIPQYDSYSCRACQKTYTGKNARSIARRHLQDKHNIPLSMQSRRNRWDKSEQLKDSLT